MNYDDLSLKQAAEVAGVSVATIRRKRAQLQAVGAVCDPSGWHVSVAQLSAVGFLDEVTPAPTPKVADTSQSTPLIEALQAHIDTLQTLLDAERARADRAEERYMRLIEAAPAPTPPQMPVEPATQEAPRAQRRWWQWRR